MLRTVKTESGMVQGLVGKDPRITVFRGVPYAKPPVGELRWKAPCPAESWEGVRKCYEYGGAACRTAITMKWNLTGSVWRAGVSLWS